jgi:signal transduction histidine kinase/CheY-like chemotaxis protein
VATTAKPFDLACDFRGWDRLRRPVWIFDPVTCRGVYANPSALSLWGAADLEELLARDFSKLSPAVRARTDRLAATTAAGETVTERWTFYPKGVPTTVQAVISTIDLGEGRSALLFESSPVTVEDEELRAVEALRHTSTMIGLFDADGRAVFSNPAAFAAFGEDRSRFTDRFSDTQEGGAVLRSVLDGTVLGTLRQVKTRQGDRYHHLDARSVLDPVSGAPAVLLSERDVTAQVEAEAALFAARERAELAESKQRFLSNMSHELRTPLTSVLGFASLLATSDLDADQAQHVERITIAGEHLLDQINDVITLSELDSGGVSLTPMAFDPVELVWDALKSIEAAAAAKGLTLDLDVADDTPQALIGDAARLRMVIDHYLSNALKFTAAGGVAVSLNAAADGDRATLEVSVRDTGPGVPDPARAHLFSRFTLADDSLSKRFQGRGLGLSICKEIMGLMEGEVGFESTESQGSRFWFRVALPIDAAVGGDHAASGVYENADTPPPLRVLYADDHESNRLLVRTLLESQGHSCALACDGREAVVAVREGDYDLVLMDIQMPEQDGVSATRDIRALPGLKAGVPVLALTANTLEAQIKLYASVGMNDVIGKPIVVAELYQKIVRWGQRGQAHLAAA